MEDALRHRAEDGAEEPAPLAAAHDDEVRVAVLRRGHDGLGRRVIGDHDLPLRRRRQRP